MSSINCSYSQKEQLGKKKTNQNKKKITKTPTLFLTIPLKLIEYWNCHAEPRKPPWTERNTSLIKKISYTSLCKNLNTVIYSEVLPETVHKIYTLPGHIILCCHEKAGRLAGNDPIRQAL